MKSNDKRTPMHGDSKAHEKNMQQASKQASPSEKKQAPSPHDSGSSQKRHAK